MEGLRRGAAALHLALTAAVIVGISVQVYLAGAYVFGAEDALDVHRSVGFATHGLEGLVFVLSLIAWLGLRMILLSFALFAVGTVQVTLSSSADWVGGLHAFGAVVLLGLAIHILISRLRARRVVAA